MTGRSPASAPRRRFVGPTGVLAAIALAVAAIPATGPGVAPASAATDKLPDLQMAKATEFRIVTTSTGRRLLRFSSLMLNLGQGAMEIRGNRASTSSPWAIDQIIYNDAGGFRRIDTTATMNYAGDGHSHWHVSKVVDHDIWSTTRTIHGSKVGFCFFDTTLWDPDLPGSPGSPVYHESTCGGASVLSSRIGISVGWGDRYQWQLPFQWIDITGIPGGTYTLRSFVDARDEFTETSNTNNCTYTRLRFTTTGTAVTVLASGSTCVNDWSTSTFAADIAWLYDEAITTGCGIDLFCPAGIVDRASMASFLARAMTLPPTAEDFFTDDETSTHEADINALAAAGITTGCTPTTYCPTRVLTRAQMASLLVRALALPTTTKDFFTDDETSTHEADINALAAAGITNGCGPTLYCPADPVLRGQMAAFLHRAFG